MSSMKINEHLLKKIKEKNINIDLNKILSQAEQTSAQLVQSQTQSQSSNLKKSEQINQQQSNNQQQNFRVRPLSAAQKKELDLMSTMASLNFQRNSDEDIIKEMQGTYIVNFNNNSPESKNLNQRKQQQQTVQDNSKKEFQLRKSQTQFFSNKIIAKDETNSNNLNKDIENNISQLQLYINEAMNGSGVGKAGLIQIITEETVEKIVQCSKEQFDQVQSVELKFDANCESLQLVGELLPNLHQLKLNYSIINSLRDLGTSLKNIRILYLKSTQLKDLSGIIALPNLQELYMAYNFINDLSSLMYNETIEVLDAEGNEIEDQVNFEYLKTMTKLQHLNLSHNPLEKKCESQFKTFAEMIWHTLPSLLTFNDIDRDCVEQTDFSQDAQLVSEEPSENQYYYEIFKQMNITDQQFEQEVDQYLRNEPNESDIVLYSIKKSVSSKLNKERVQPSEQIDFFKTSNSFFQSNQLQPSTAAPSKQQQSKIKKENIFKDATSDLVHGTNEVFFGNPIKVMKHRKKQGFIDPANNDLPKDIINLLEMYSIDDESDLNQYQLTKSAIINSNIKSNNPQQQIIIQSQQNSKHQYLQKQLSCQQYKQQTKELEDRNSDKKLSSELNMQQKSSIQLQQKYNFPLENIVEESKKQIQYENSLNNIIQNSQPGKVLFKRKLMQQNSRLPPPGYFQKKPEFNIESNLDKQKGNLLLGHVRSGIQLNKNILMQENINKINLNKIVEDDNEQSSPPLQQHSSQTQIPKIKRPLIRLKQQTKTTKQQD